MPKIPTYDAPQVAPEALPAPQVHLDTAGMGEGMGRAVQSLGQSVGGMADSFLAEKKHQEEQADSLATTNAITEVKRRLDDRAYNPDTGYMVVRGQNALAAQQGLDEWMHGQVDDVAEKMLTNDRQRRLFAMHMSGELEDRHKQAEAYVAQEIHLAKQASVEGLENLTADGLARGYYDASGNLDRATVDREVARVEGPIKAQALSATDADAKVARWRQTAYSTLLNGVMDRQDFASAQKLMADPSVQQGLGMALPKYQRALVDLGNQVYGQHTAKQIVLKATNPESGLVDDSKIQPQVDALPEGPRQKAVQEALLRERAMAEESNKALINNHFRDALSALYQTRSLSGVPAPARAWLVQYAPEEWGKLEEAQHRMFEHGRARAADTPEQTQTFIEAMRDLNSRPDYWAKQDPTEWERQWGVNLSPKDQRAAGLAFARAREAKPGADKPLPHVEADTVTRIFQHEMGKPADSRKWDENTTTLWHRTLDRVTAARQAWQKDHPGKEPDLETVESWAKRELVKTPVPGTGFMGFFQKETRPIDTAGPPPERTVNGVRYVLNPATGNYRRAQ